MNPETVIFLLKLACFFICIALLTRRGLPTKFVYKLRFDKPLKFGNFFIGKIGLTRNIIGFISLITLCQIILSIRAKIPKIEPSPHEVMLSANATVRLNNGYIVENLIYIAFAVIVGLMAYKAYKYYKLNGFNKKPSMVQNSSFDALEEVAKLELFDLMYKKGVLDLPLKPKTINNFTYIKEDDIWIPYSRAMTYRAMLKKWIEEN